MKPSVFFTILILLVWPALQYAQSLVADVDTGRVGYNPHHVILGKNSFLFIASDLDDTYGYIGKGDVLYKSTGENGSTKALFGTSPTTQGGKIWGCTIFDDEAYFGFYLKKTISIIKVNLSTDSVQIVQKFDTRLLHYELFSLNFTTYQGKVFFFFQNELSEFELWKTGGNENSTELVYTFPTEQKIYDVYRSHKCIFFSSTNQQKISQLWRINLELAKADILHSFKNGSLRKGEFKTVQILKDRLIFQDNINSDKPSELWIADETSPTSIQIVLQTPGIVRSRFEFIGVNKDKFIFQSEEVSQDLKQKNASGEYQEIRTYTIWSTDGSVSGTQQILKFPEETHFSPNAPVIVNDYLYFFLAKEGFYKLNLVKPRRYEKIIAAPIGDDYYYFDYHFVGIQDKYFYFFSTRLRNLFKTDGTSEGSKFIPIGDEVSYVTGRYGRKEAVINDDFFFFSGKGADNSLWKMSTHTGSISQVVNELSKNTDNYPLPWKEKLLINVDDPMYGMGLWIYQAGNPLKRLEDVPQRPKGSHPLQLNYFDGCLYFLTADIKLGMRWQRLDIKTRQVSLISELLTKPNGNVANPYFTDSALYFGFRDSPQKETLKIEKGNPYQLKKAPSPDSLHYYFIGKGGLIPTYYHFNKFLPPKRVIRFSETRLNIDTLWSKKPEQLYELDGGYALWLKDKSPTVKQLFLTDGSSKGTYLLKEGVFNQWRPARISDGIAIPKMKDLYYVYFPDEQHGLELWSFDLATRNLNLVKDLVPGPEGSQFVGSACLSNKCLFLSKDQKGVSFWLSDGTTKGTTRMDSILFARYPKYKSYSKVNTDFYNLHTWGHYIFFNLKIRDQIAQLWRTDGTPEGTIPLSNDMGFSQLFHLGPHIYYFQQSSTHGEELWRTDGTTEGTTMLFDLNPGPASSFPNSLTQLSLTQVNDEVYFSADDGIHGSELFKFKPAEVGTHTPKPYVGKWEKTEQKYILNYQDLRDQKTYSHTLYSSAGEIVEVQPIFEKNKATIGTQKCTSGTYWLVVSNGKQKWMEAITVD